MKNYFTKRQLLHQGASPEDANELARIAKDLRGSVPGLNPDVKKQIAQDIGFKPAKNTTNLRFATAGAFVALVVLSVVAQSAQPGSVLYALKRGTEEVRVILQPGFDEDDIQQRREDERQHEIEDNKQEEDTTSEQSDDAIKADDATENSQSEVESSEKDTEDATDENVRQQEDEPQTNQEDTETTEPDKSESPEDDSSSN